MAATTGVATNTERSLSLPYYLPHKAIHHNTDCHGKCAQEHQYGHSARAVQEKRGNWFGSAGKPTPVTTSYSQITHIHARYKCHFACLDVITPTLCKEMNTIHRNEPQKNDTQLVPTCTTQLVRFRQTALSDHTPYPCCLALHGCLLGDSILHGLQILLLQAPGQEHS